LTYRTLKRQFGLDDAALDDLREELVDGQRLAIDEDSRVLVWIGEPASAPNAEEHHGTRNCVPETGNPAQSARRVMAIIFAPSSARFAQDPLPIERVHEDVAIILAGNPFLGEQIFCPLRRS
jgi:hypothetical protein